MGGDGILPHILKYSSTTLLYTIHHLLMLCLDQSWLPLEWSSDYITPIPNSVDMSAASNYQSISLVYFMSQAVERLLLSFWCPPLYLFSSLDLPRIILLCNNWFSTMSFPPVLVLIVVRWTEYISVYARVTILFHMTASIQLPFNVTLLTFLPLFALSLPYSPLMILKTSKALCPLLIVHFSRNFN